MRFASPLIPATLVRRYKRFLADVVLPSGELITAHVANPGAMTGLATPGAASPVMAPGLATWAVMVSPVGNTTSARKRL